MWWDAFRLITVEPIQMIYCIMITMSNVVHNDLVLLKVCEIDFSYSHNKCINALQQEGGKAAINETVYDEIQRRTALLMTWYGVLVAIPAIICCIFVGPWSDAHGRKLIIAVPFVGQFISYVTLLANYFWFYDINSNFVLLASLSGVTGDYFCLNIGLFGYISDITTTDNRTVRLSILNGVFSVSFALGNALGGYLYGRFRSFYLNFGLSALLSLVALVYVIFFVSESVKNEQINRRQYFFDISNVTSIFSCIFRSENCVWLCVLVVNFSIFMVCLNTHNFDYLMVKSNFGWNASDFYYYLTAKRFFRFLGLVVFFPLLSRILQINDIALVLVGTVITMAAYIVQIMARWGWMIYLGGILQMNSIITVIFRSKCTKLVAFSDIGKVLSAIATCEALVPIISLLIFGWIYQSTLSFFPGAYMIPIVGLFVFVLLSSLYLLWFERSSPTLAYLETEESASFDSDVSI